MNVGPAELLILKRARVRLGEDAFEAAVARGQRLNLDETIDLALSLDAPAATAG